MTGHQGQGGDDMDRRHIRVAIVHNNRLLRECLVFILAQQRDIAVVGSAERLVEANGNLTSLEPTLFVLDFGLPGRTGLEDARRVRALSPEFRILMIGVPDNESDVLACIEGGGASGYLLQDASLETLINNVRAIAAGETLCSPRIANLAFSRMSALARRNSEPRLGNMGSLTRRESEIVALIEAGLSNKEIAVRLSIEVQTVKNHVHNILDKLQLEGRREAARYVKEQGLSLIRADLPQVASRLP